MQESLQRALFAQIGELCRTRTTVTAGSELAHPASAYWDPVTGARERTMLARQPQIAVHGSAIPKPGDFVSHSRLGPPIIVTRQADGGVKALLNICTHRGARVCSEASGSAKQFSCRYHGWTYRSDGSLVGVPRSAFPNLVAANAGLTELPVEERHGFVWVVPTPGLPIDIAAHLGSLDAELASYGMADHVLWRDTERRPDINWKSVIDGFMEVYHIPKLHTDSIAPWFYGTHSPFEPVGRHGRMVGVRKSFDRVRDLPFDDVDMMPHIAVNYFIFPNTVMVWQRDHFEVWTSFPSSDTGRCTVHVQSLASPALTGPEHNTRWERNWKILIETVEAEDWSICREIQGSLPYVRDDRLLFGANEPALQHFHTSVTNALSE